MSTASASDRFQSRDELVSFIEEQAATAVERAARVERRVPWATAGPVCQDSAGYSVLNAVFATIVCLTGTVAHIAWAVPVDVGIAIVLWIGIVITAQAFQATPASHAPAVVMGLLPGVGAFRDCRDGLRSDHRH